MLKVGITGRSGSGKTMVASHYASLGYPIADGDAISRDIMLPGHPALEELAAVFGEDILAQDGSLKRQVLGSRAFAKPDGNQKLIDITHPHIINRMLELADIAAECGAPLFFMDGAMIVGYSLHPYCDKLIVVSAPQKDAINRIMKRDGIDEATAIKRLGAQTPQAALDAAADFVIENDTTPEALVKQADEVLQKLLELG